MDNSNNSKSFQTEKSAQRGARKLRFCTPQRNPRGPRPAETALRAESGGAESFQTEKTAQGRARKLRFGAIRGMLPSDAMFCAMAASLLQYLLKEEWKNARA